MGRSRLKHLLIVSALLTLFLCMTSVSFASNSSHKVQIDAGDNTIIPINSIDKDGTRHLFLPSGTTEDKLIFDEGDDISNYEVMTDENIGSLHFYSDDPENYGMDYIHGSRDHSTKAPGRIVLLDENANVEYEGGVEAIKGRGNRTWHVKDKKPYQIKLTNKANLLNPSDTTQKAKKWILLANALDMTLIRNQIAYSMAKELGLENSPDGRQVDLYYDGEYLGVYYICEKVEIGKGRVDIADPDKTPGNVQCSYLLEIDNGYYMMEPYSFEVSPAGHFVIKEPEELTEQQTEYIESFVKEAMSVIAAGGKNKDGEFVLFDYIDKDSCVKYFLSTIWINNEDVFHSSTYMYKPAGEDKLYFGPVWDCDVSMGTSSPGKLYDEWIIRRVGQKLMNISEFRQALKDEYETDMEPILKEILLGHRQGAHLNSLDAISNEMKIPALMNYTALDLKNGTDLISGYQKSTEALKSWLVCRSEWFKANIYDENFVTGEKKESETTQPTISSPVVNNAPKVTDNTKTKTIKLAKPKLKVIAKKKTLNLSWSKVKGAKGYQIRYCKKASKKKWKYKTTTKNKYNLKKIKRRTKYIVQIRAYSVKSGRKYYGKWTNELKKSTKQHLSIKKLMLNGKEGKL